MAVDGCTLVTRSFSIADYVLFAATLCLSAAVGLFYAVKERRKQTTEEFLFGSRKIQVLPVTLSLCATFLSALTLLGTPTEMYNYHTMFWWICVGFVFAVFGTSSFFLPVFYNLQLTSVFEYLEMRFGRVVRLVACAAYIVQMMIYMAFVLYAPSLALNAATGMHLWGTVVGVAVVCTLYTTLGGMKAVVWTDTIQMFIIIAGLLAALIQGSITMDGFGNAWDIADNHSRIVFTDISFDPATRHSVWTVAIGGGFFWLSLYAVNQAQVQRACSCPSLTKAKLALWLNLSGLVVTSSILCMIGILIFAFYSSCDPVSCGRITKSDQLLPLFIMDILGYIQGVPGLFLSCLFSGSLSTISSGLNAMAAVVLQDFVRPLCCKNLSDFHSTLASKLIVVLAGGVSLALAYIVSLLGPVMQASMTVYAILNGPLFGLFVLGMFFPWSNKWGAMAGFVLSTVLMSWIGIGAFVHKVFTPRSHVSSIGCAIVASNITTTITSTVSTVGSTLGTTVSSVAEDPVYKIYTLSYLWYTATGMLALLVIALIVSFMTGYTKPSAVDPRLICPFFDIILPCLPESIRKPLRFGVRHGEVQTEKDNKDVLHSTDSNVKKASENKQFTNPSLTGKTRKDDIGPEHINITLENNQILMTKL